MDKHQTVIGKDVIESLTLGMYEDARTIYREYVQNSADQIDKAVKLGILPSRKDGYIEIEIDKDRKTITISDNATGIKAAEAVAILRNIAQSTKRRGIDKGFRGIGRLGGLGYCNKLTFETSYSGEKVQTVMVWFADTLKNIIGDRSHQEEAAEVIDMVTKFATFPEEENEHYFKVTLEKVSNNLLLDKQAIRDYLSMIAPVTFQPGFTLVSEIRRYCEKKQFSLDEYNIAVNGDPIYKAYTLTIYEGEGADRAKKVDELKELQFFDFYTQDHNLLCWGWYGISDFNKQLPEKVNLARGLRLRKGNIQIGDEYCLVKFHKEQRGNFYFLGEVHASHIDLLPNARRDYFLENEVTKLFENQLRNKFGELHKLYYFASKVRNTHKRITQRGEFTKEYEEKSQSGFVNPEELASYTKKCEKFTTEAEKAEKELAKLSSQLRDGTPQKRVFDSITKPITVEPSVANSPAKETPNKIKFVFEDLKLSYTDKKLVARLFSVVEKVLTEKLPDKEMVRELAQHIKTRIFEEFNK